MKNILTLIAIFCTINFSFSNTLIKGKEKYFAKVVSVMGNYEGYIKLNINDENADMLEVVTEIITEKSKGKKSTTSSGISLNIKIVRSITIDSTTYEIKDIEYSEGKFYKNCCVKKVNTNGLIAMYSWGTKTDASSYFLVAKNYNQLKATQLVRTTTSFLYFKGCSELLSKIRKKETGYTIVENATNDEVLTSWTKWIEESKSCVVVN